REVRAQAPEGGEIVPLALDRVEIGDIKDRKRIDRDEAADDRDGIAARRQRRFERPVGRALAHSRADDLAAHEVDDRDGLQVSSLRSVRFADRARAGSVLPLSPARTGLCAPILSWTCDLLCATCQLEGMQPFNCHEHSRGGAGWAPAGQGRLRTGPCAPGAPRTPRRDQPLPCRPPPEPPAPRRAGTDWRRARRRLSSARSGGLWRAALRPPRFAL